ncbi:type II secretion system F family protein [Halobacteria archaeon AArc-m2/3/4]|uniref:Type II secretion system F family protein n=1 Tax=Natronoglomus mannanivorans TaxID=2979990 RepID=A0ABT2Q956_9EURY|nr:type II secretion system F family protein [Halobacteria archaeon AArc-m2/3/4]
MSPTTVLPLLFVLALVVPVALARYHDGVDRVLTRAAIGIFGDYVDEFRSEHPDRQAALRAAHVPRTYREYGSKTLLSAGLFAVGGSVLGIYVIWLALALLAIDPETMREALPSALEFLANLGGVPTLSPLELAVLLFCSGLTLGVATGAGTYWLRWWYPSHVASNRARRIEATLPGTVAFVYALSRSGMEFPRIVRIVAANSDTYGTAAAEFDVAVRNMDTFGMDVVTAVQTMGRRTASPQFREFSENLVSVLQSGHSLSTFLERQYHDYQEDAESQQESMLDLLATLAEAYVTVLVAGPLFLITILVVIGFSIGDTLEPLRALVYVILPLGNLAFVIYLSTVTDAIDPGRADVEQSTTEAETERRMSSVLETAGTAQTDGGVGSARGSSARAHNIERVRLYRRVRSIRERIATPVETILEHPTWLFGLTIPLALGAVLWRIRETAGDGSLELAAVDDTIALATLFVLATFALVYEVHRYRVDAIEAAVPDLLDRLASVNEAGMPLVSAIDHVRGSDLGALDAELDRLWADMQWGADLETALHRFGSRVRTQTTARVVTLLSAAMNASGNLSTVLRIAARQASADRRLQRERKQGMLEYMVVVYVSFLVFLFIVAVLSAYLLPNMPTESVGTEMGAMGDAGGFGGVGEVDAATYTLLFYHATLVQGVMSGFIAGQLSTGDVKAGAKHAAVMVAVAILLFAVI